MIRESKPLGQISSDQRSSESIRPQQLGQMSSDQKSKQLGQMSDQVYL